SSLRVLQLPVKLVADTREVFGAFDVATRVGKLPHEYEQELGIRRGTPLIDLLQIRQLRTFGVRGHLCRQHRRQAATEGGDGDQADRKARHGVNECTNIAELIRQTSLCPAQLPTTCPLRTLSMIQVADLDFRCRRDLYPCAASGIHAVPDGL